MAEGMRNRLASKGWSAAPICIVVSISAAWAADDAVPETRLDGVARYTVSEVSREMLANGWVVVRQRLTGKIDTSDTWELFDGNVQDCFASSVLLADGSEVETTGSCTAFDEVGDTWALWFHNKGNTRIWSVISGTGKYAGMSGGGSTIVTSQAGDQLAISWGATIRFDETK